MIDILLDGDFDLDIENGDFVLGDPTEQNQQLILLSSKGENREFPTRGVGQLDWLLSNETGDLNGEIKQEFEADGMTVEAVNTTSSGTINVVAYYES